jgi:hypothetical protein
MGKSLVATGRSLIPDKAKVDELLTRARAVTQNRPRAAVLAPQQLVIQLPMICSASGQSFVAIAEREGDVLRLVRGVRSRAGTGNGDRPPPLTPAGRVIAGRGWSCPHCGISHLRDLWWCDCPAFAGLIHCGGTAGRSGKGFCACGIFEAREFDYAPSIPVHGERVGRSGSMPGTARPDRKALALLPPPQR